MRDTYKFGVTFSRSLSADVGVVNATHKKEHDPESPEGRRALVQQMRTELQMAYDDSDIAIDGQFNIDYIELDGVRYDSLTGERV